MTPKRNGNTAGFTLLEMLVVLVLVAVITAVAVPVAGGAIQTLRLQSAARHVAAMPSGWPGAGPSATRRSTW